MSEAVAVCLATEASAAVRTEASLVAASERTL